VYNETEWVQTETTAEVRDGIHYWADLDAEPLPVDAAGWAERRTDMGLGRADKDISQYAVDDMGTRVISVENPRCVIYEPPGAGDVVYVAFRGTLTRDDINVILAHALAEFTIGGYAWRTVCSIWHAFAVRIAPCMWPCAGASRCLPTRAWRTS
jgi:hypothetical protein